MLWLELVYSDVNNILFFLVGSFPPSQPEKIFLKRGAAALKDGERAFKGHPKKWEETLRMCLGSISVIPWQLSDDVIWGVSSVKVNVLVTVVSDSAIPWTVAHQPPLSMEFSRQEYWSRLPFRSPGNLPDPGIEPRSPALRADSLPSEPPGKPIISACWHSGGADVTAHWKWTSIRQSRCGPGNLSSHQCGFFIPLQGHSLSLSPAAASHHPLSTPLSLHPWDRTSLPAASWV